MPRIHLMTLPHSICNCFWLSSSSLTATTTTATCPCTPSVPVKINWYHSLWESPYARKTRLNVYPTYRYNYRMYLCVGEFRVEKLKLSGIRGTADIHEPGSAYRQIVNYGQSSGNCFTQGRPAVIALCGWYLCGADFKNQHTICSLRSPLIVSSMLNAA